jgi:ASC-1-like (ASCH) protein
MADGDTIIFSLSGESSDSNPIKTIITDITNHKSFEDMISQHGLLNVLPGIETIQKGVAIYRQFYSPEKETEFGVVGIHIKLI